MDWKETLAKLAPTVATALGGPLAGAAVSALGDLLGISEPTQEKIKAAIESGQLTGQQIADLKSLELKLQAEEKERGFRYAELEFKDRDSARKASVDGGTLNKLFWFSIWLVTTVLVSELIVLRYGIPHGVPEIVVGRILGLLDSIAIQVLNFWYGTSSGSVRKTDLMVNK
jgi:hypothetical protein